jgi:membrane protease YdiL (CAAX protease family)
MRDHERMSEHGWVWHSPPGWPEPPAGWIPPDSWQAPPEWPAPPSDWVYWIPAGPGQQAPGQAAAGAAGWPAAPQPAAPQPAAPQPAAARPAHAPPTIRIAEQSRRGLAAETWFVQIAFLFPGIVAAVDVLAAHLGGVSDINRFPTVVPGHPVENLVLGIFSYLAVGAVVPLALLLLARTGQGPAELGLGVPRLRADLWPGLGLAVGGYGVTLLVVLPFSVLMARHSSLFSQIQTGHVPKYYVLFGVAVSAITAITEETLVSGYLLTRLEQFGWTPQRALSLSLTLRTSYHVYYGLGFLFTIPVGYLLTRSFQKHRRLTRPIVAHFIFDAVLITISVLAS